MAGAVALYGRTPRITRLTDDQWRAAGGAGFEIVSGGEPSIREFLTRFQSTYERSLGGKEKPNAFYGRFQQWLAGSAKDPAYDPLKEIIRLHAQQTLPVGPRDVMFGRTFERRVLHSLYTASAEFGVNAETLRTILAGKNLLPDGHEVLTPNLVYFPAEAARDILQIAGERISLKQAETYLNAGRVPTRVLYEKGLIKPILQSSEDGLNAHWFARSDLDAFLARLTAKAVLVNKANAGAEIIQKAARLANCGIVEVIRLILDDKLLWIGRVKNVPGFLGVLVNAGEVKRAVRSPPLDGMSAFVVERELKTNFAVVKALIERELLPAKRVANPASRHSVRLVDRQDFDAFQAKYISLMALAHERGVHFRKTQAELNSRGVRPALDPRIFQARFYLRKDVGAEAYSAG